MVFVLRGSMRRRILFQVLLSLSLAVATLNAASGNVRFDREIKLQHKNWRAVVGVFGASLRQLYVKAPEGGKTDFIWGYSGRKNQSGGQGDVLIPFPNRTKDGKYSFEGVSHQMPQNDHSGPNAIHGFLQAVSWDVEAVSQDRVSLRTSITKKAFEKKGYPFDVDVRLTYSLGDNGLAVKFKIQNMGKTRAPIGVGFHPYFVVGTDFVNTAELRVPAMSYLEADSVLIPTGRKFSTKDSDFDFTKSKQVGERKLDLCFVDLVRDSDGKARILLKNPTNGQTVTVWMGEAFQYVMLFTGDTLASSVRRRALAIEPMTMAPDALNRPDWGLKILEPAQVFEAEFGVGR